MIPWMLRGSFSACALVALYLSLVACNSDLPSAETSLRPPQPPQAVIFFLGDGMGIATMTAARIYAAGEDGELTMDTLPEVGYVRTYSNDSMVTDSAASMSAYMTGVKMNNSVLSMSTDTQAIPSGCPPGNGTPVPTLLELAKAQGYATGVVTTTRITHATPAATYAHICHRDLEDAIAVQAVPGGAGYNAALGDGVDVLLGGGRRHFLPAGTAPSVRTDRRDLTAELTGQGYRYVSDASSLAEVRGSGKVLGLFSADHMSYELDRDRQKEPSLAEMTSKAIEVLRKNPRGYFLMVEGGRIDHALHNSNAIRALADAVAFDDAIRTALTLAAETDPDLASTLVVVVADHDHSLVLNGDAKLTGPTTPDNPGILGLVRSYVTGAVELDADGSPYSILGFGNGEHRVAGARGSGTALSDRDTAAHDYRQEAGVLRAVGDETHGGTDVFVGAAGHGAERFRGFLGNTEVFDHIRKAAGL